MLDTVLQIGKTFRYSPNGLKYHRYIETLNEKNREKATFLFLPVREDFSFDFEGIKEIVDENIIKNKLFYLKFKTSDQDGAIKYIYGDIYYGKNKNGKEFGNYRTTINAFENGYKYLKKTRNESLLSFANSFRKDVSKFNELLNKYDSVYINFDFKGKHWYEQSVVDEINKIMVENFTESIISKNQTGLVFQKMLYRTLCSGDDKNDRQFPSFSNVNKYKARLFSEEDVINLFYGINYTEKATITPFNFKVARSPEKIKIVVLPKENGHYSNLTAKDYEDFSTTREEVIKAAYELKDNDWVFSSLLSNVNDDVIAFDVIFVKEGARVDNDVLEISGLEKSFLKIVNDRINRIRSECEQEYGRNFFIIDAFIKIFNDNSASLKKYQNHLYKILPQIYSGNYYYDPILLQTVIARIEYLIRNQDNGKNIAIGFQVNQLKYDFYFLTKIQNTIKEGENLMNILDSPSYKIGLLIGKMAVPLKYDIKSFEKNYVGNLTRRIASLDDLVKFKTFMEEKLIIHDKTYPSIKEASMSLAESVKSFSGRFDKNECAFGFFESYFTVIKSQNDDSLSNNENKN